MAPRKWLALVVICSTVFVAEVALPQQAIAGNRRTAARRVEYLADQSGQPRVVPQPVPGRTWGGGYYYAPTAYKRAHYVGGWAGVSPPVSYPPFPGAYWAYGYSQYPFGAYYGW